MWRRKTYSDRDRTIRVIFKRDFSFEKQTNNKSRERLKLERKRKERKKKGKIIIRYINETIGKRNIELGRDTYGDRKKESAHDYPSDNENISQLEVNRGGRTLVRHFLRNATHEPCSRNGKCFRLRRAETLTEIME